MGNSLCNCVQLKLQRPPVGPLEKLRSDFYDLHSVTVFLQLSVSLEKRGSVGSLA
jgi:hypothetical protein